MGILSRKLNPIQKFLLAPPSPDSPEKCIVLEDAQAGIEAGNRAGMLTIGIGDPHRLCAAKLSFLWI